MILLSSRFVSHIRNSVINTCHQVRGLPWEATAMDLCKFFRDCEIVGGPSGIFFCQNERGQPTGEAFIEMERQEDVDRALERHKQNMGRRWEHFDKNEQTFYNKFCV